MVHTHDLAALDFMDIGVSTLNDLVPSNSMPMKLPDHYLQFDPIPLDEVSRIDEPLLGIWPFLEVLFQSYGMARCTFYDDSGVWVGQ